MKKKNMEVKEKLILELKISLKNKNNKVLLVKIQVKLLVRPINNNNSCSNNSNLLNKS